MYVTRRTLLLTLCGWGWAFATPQAFIRRIVSRVAGQAGAAGGQAVRRSPKSRRSWPLSASPL